MKASTMAGVAVIVLVATGLAMFSVAKDAEAQYQQPRAYGYTQSKVEMYGRTVYVLDDKLRGVVCYTKSPRYYDAPISCVKYR